MKAYYNFRWFVVGVFLILFGRIPLTADLSVDYGNPQGYFIEVAYTYQTDPIYHDIALENVYLYDVTPWVAVDNCAWLDVDPNSGVLGPHESIPVTVTVYPAGLSVGYYEYEILFINPDDANQWDIAKVQFKISEDCWTGDATSRFTWESVGAPACWCSSINPRQCHGDADGQSEGKMNYFVATQDLNILIQAWNQKRWELVGQSYNGVELICADLNHTPQGKGAEYPVSTDDLSILLSNWNIPGGPAPDCVDALGVQ